MHHKNVEQIQQMQNKVEQSLSELVELANKEPELKEQVVGTLDNISWEFREASIDLSEQLPKQ